MKSRVSIPSLVLLTRTGFPTTVSWRYLPRNPPLLDDNTRREELAARLRANWWGIAYNERILDSFVRSQLSIERHIEAALVADGYSPDVLMERRNQIRGFLFYPEGRALSENADAGHLAQIETLGTRQSVPYRRFLKAVRNGNFLF